LSQHFARLGDMDETDAAEAFFDFRVADIMRRIDRLRP